MSDKTSLFGGDGGDRTENAISFERFSFLNSYFTVLIFVVSFGVKNPVTRRNKKSGLQSGFLFQEFFEDFSELVCGLLKLSVYLVTVYAEGVHVLRVAYEHFHLRFW